MRNNILKRPVGHNQFMTKNVKREYATAAAGSRLNPYRKFPLNLKQRYSFMDVDDSRPKFGGARLRSRGNAIYMAMLEQRARHRKILFKIRTTFFLTSRCNRLRKNMEAGQLYRHVSRIQMPCSLLCSRFRLWFYSAWSTRRADRPAFW